MFSKVLINVTPYCNLNCPYCYRSYEKVESKETNYYDSLFTNNILSILNSEKFCSITITGGEPSVFRRLEYLVTECLSYKDVNIITNGIKLLDMTPEILSKIDITVSLDGSYEISKKTRGINIEDYENIVENGFFYLNNAKSLSINTVVNKYNINALKYEPFEIFGEDVSYKFSVPSIIYTPKEYRLSQNEYVIVLNRIIYLIKKYNYKFNCTTNLIKKEVFMNNYKNIIPNIMYIEYRLENDKFYLFGLEYDDLNSVFNDYNSKIILLEKKILEYISNEKLDCFDPYSIAELVLCVDKKG